MQFGGASGDVFSAICIMQISRFTASKPSKFAFASDEKSIRQPTTSFVRCYLRSADSENLTTSNKSQVEVGENEGVKGAIADFVRFHCPLSPPQRRNPLLAEKSCYVCKTNCVVAPIWRDNVRVAGKASCGRSCGSAKLRAGTLRCLHPLLTSPLEWSTVELLGRCPKPHQRRRLWTPQGALPLDPFLRPGLSAFPCYPLSLIRLSFPQHYSKKSFH